MQRKIIGARVAQELFAVETAVETTYGAMAQFAGLLATARTEANLSAVYGQEVMEDVNAAMAHLLQARRALVKAHGGLAEVHDQIADLISAQSWADVVAQLREHAADLSSSAIARNQLKARALEVAADNLVGGRAAFTDWPAFFSAELQPGP